MWCNSCDDAKVSYEMGIENKYCPNCSDRLVPIGWINNEEM
jgi:hypothetical protein